MFRSFSVEHFLTLSGYSQDKVLTQILGQRKNTTNGKFYRKFISSLQVGLLSLMFFPRYTQGQMYNVVADVGSYKHFIPYCSQSRVISRKTGDNGVLDMQGELTVTFLGLEETYISNVHCRPNQLVQVCFHSFCYYIRKCSSNSMALGSRVRRNTFI